MDSFIKWMGGKSKMRENIISMIPAHKTYIELFAGGSWVLFAKPKSQIEVINDIDDNLINLYMTVRDNPENFIEEFNKLPISETLFKEFAMLEGNTSVVVDGECIPSVDLAIKTYFVLMNSFNGIISETPTFAISNSKRAGSVKFHKTDWDMVKNRLKEVTILNRDFRNVIEKYDSPESFFYLDPPYTCAVDNSHYYRFTFTNEDHLDLKVYLSDIAGKFILSMDNKTAVKELYKEFIIEDVGNNELLIMNYEPEDNHYFCREGIPHRSMDKLNEGDWKIPNCPYCGSRNVHSEFMRVTLENGKRSFVRNGYGCRSCKDLFK